VTTLSISARCRPTVCRSCTAVLPVIPRPERASADNAACSVFRRLRRKPCQRRSACGRVPAGAAWPPASPVDQPLGETPAPQSGWRRRRAGPRRHRVINPFRLMLSPSEALSWLRDRIGSDNVCCHSLPSPEQTVTLRAPLLPWRWPPFGASFTGIYRPVPPDPASSRPQLSGGDHPGDCAARQPGDLRPGLTRICNVDDAGSRPDTERASSDATPPDSSDITASKSVQPGADDSSGLEGCATRSHRAKERFPNIPFWYSWCSCMQVSRPLLGWGRLRREQRRSRPPVAVPNFSFDRISGENVT